VTVTEGSSPPPKQFLVLTFFFRFIFRGKFQKEENAQILWFSVFHSDNSNRANQKLLQLLSLEK
jgi:hypothetical protein